MTDEVTEAVEHTPEQLAAYHARFLPGGPPVTVEALKRHAQTHGGYLVAETAWDHGLVSPVPAEDDPRQTRQTARKRR